MKNLADLEKEVRQALNNSQIPQNKKAISILKKEIKIFKKQYRATRNYVEVNADETGILSPKPTKRLIFKITNTVTTIIQIIEDELNKQRAQPNSTNNIHNENLLENISKKLTELNESTCSEISFDASIDTESDLSENPTVSNQEKPSVFKEKTKKNAIIKKQNLKNGVDDLPFILRKPKEIFAELKPTRKKNNKTTHENVKTGEDLLKNPTAKLEDLKTFIEKNQNLRNDWDKKKLIENPEETNNKKRLKSIVKQLTKEYEISKKISDLIYEIYESFDIIEKLYNDIKEQNVKSNKKEKYKASFLYI